MRWRVVGGRYGARCRLSDGAVLVEADNEVLLVVGAGDRIGLGIDPGVEPEEIARVALHGTRMGGDAGGVLVADCLCLGRA